MPLGVFMFPEDFKYFEIIFKSFDLILKILA